MLFNILVHEHKRCSKYTKAVSDFHCRWMEFDVKITAVRFMILILSSDNKESRELNM